MASPLFFFFFLRLAVKFGFLLMNFCLRGKKRVYFWSVHSVYFWSFLTFGILTLQGYRRIFFFKSVQASISLQVWEKRGAKQLQLMSAFNLSRCNCTGDQFYLSCCYCSCSGLIMKTKLWICRVYFLIIVLVQAVIKHDSLREHKACGKWWRAHQIKVCFAE